MANLPKQHRSVYENSFKLKHVLQNLQGYKLATGGVDSAHLRQAREVYGDAEGKVYGALVSKEAETSWTESGRGEQGQRLRRKRRRRGKLKVERNISKPAPSFTTSASPSTSNPRDKLSPGSYPSHQPSPSEQSGGSGANISSSLKLLSSAYSDSSEESSREDAAVCSGESRLPVPEAIQNMFKETSSVPAGGAKAFSSLTRSHDSDSDPDDLGYFEPIDSGDSVDSEEEPSKVRRLERSREDNMQQTTGLASSSHTKWDSDKNKFVFSPSPLSSYVCWKCSKVGHLPSDCTVAVNDGGKRRGRREQLRIPSELKSLYSKCRELQRRKADHCAECGVHSNLAHCLECGCVYCDGRGHLSSHLLSHPSHNQLYSYKLARILKCCKATCPVVNIYDLLVCSHCLSRAFSQHYSMVNATWSQGGLQRIPNALCCGDHFDWHRMNCPGVGEEHFMAAASLHDKVTGLPLKQISEFFL